MAPNDTLVKDGDSPEGVDDTRSRTAVPAPKGTADTETRTPEVRAPETQAKEISYWPTNVDAPSTPTTRGVLREGYRLRDRYLLEELIGQGAMGQVWRAKDLLGEEARDRAPYVAVKVLNRDFENHPDAFIGMHREASRAQKLAHPNIVTVHVFDRDDASGNAFIAMELLRGKPLDKLIREAGPNGLPREEALPIIRGMAEGLAYAHRKGIVHSDFKPANVFLNSEGVPKILDFGIARAVQVAEEAGGVLAIELAEDSIFQGYTPPYASPEAIADREPSTSDDVFALGVVSYELLTGRHPFNRKSAVEARDKGLRPEPVRGLKRREARAIEKALMFERSERFPDAAAFNKALQGVAPLQKGLAAVVAVLALTAGFLWYRNYLETRPAIAFGELPAEVQQEIRKNLRDGNESLSYLERTRDIEASADAAQYFADAYKLHPRNRDAVAGLERAADEAIKWYMKLPDRRMALEELRKFQAKSEFYAKYAPLKDAIESLERQQ